MFSISVILKMTTLPLRPASISCAFRTNAQLLSIMLPFTRSWELRRLEDTEDAADEDENNNDDSSDGKLMSIEHEVESALVEMFTMHQANGQDVTGHLSLSSLTLRRRPRTSPSVHRIDMERTGISLQHSLNPEERAYRRDSEMFCSHMNMVLWDMPPPKRVDIMTQILIFLASIWNGFLQILFWGNRSSRRQAFPGMSLANEHALMYTSDNQDVVLGLLQETTLIMNAKLHGSRKQHGAQYVAFVRETLDRISPPLSNEEDGFSSDEGE